MTPSSALYYHLPKVCNDGTVDCDSDTLRLALLSSVAAFNPANTVWADLSANEVSGTGYTAGGFALTGVTVTEAAGVTTVDAADLELSGVTATFRYGVVYADVTRNGLVKPLLKWILFDSTPADVVLAGGAFPIVWSDEGVVKHVVEV